MKKEQPIDAIAGHERDNVATALVEIAAGTTARTRIGQDVKALAVHEPIRYGHKFALAPLARGASVVKYGEVIGVATADIAAGRHVHVHNVASLRGRGDLA